MMFCPKCGRECKDGRFCMGCGTRLPEEAVGARNAAPWRPGMACPFCGANEVEGNRCAYCGGVLILDVEAADKQEEGTKCVIPGVYQGENKGRYLKLEKDGLTVRNGEEYEEVRILYEHLTSVGFHRSGLWSWISFRWKETEIVDKPSDHLRALADVATFVFSPADVPLYKEIYETLCAFAEKNSRKELECGPDGEDKELPERFYKDFELDGSSMKLGEDHVEIKGMLRRKVVSFSPAHIRDIHFHYNGYLGWMTFWWEGGPERRAPRNIYGAAIDVGTVLFNEKSVMDFAEIYLILKRRVKKPCNGKH